MGTRASFQGQKEYERYMKGETLSWKESALALCYDCMCFYIDGGNDCGSVSCPMYPHMPYAMRPSKGRVSPKKATTAK